MRNTHRDRYDNKLRRFLDELGSVCPCSPERYNTFRNGLLRKYGLTVDDWHRAIRLTDSGNAARRWFKSTNCRNDKTHKELRYEDHVNDELSCVA